MKIEWKNAEAGKRFTELVARGDDMTVAEMAQLLSLEGHNVTVEGPVLAVYSGQPVNGVTLTVSNPGKPGDVLP